MYIDMFVACMILSGKDQVRKGCAGDMKDNLEDYLVKLNDTDRKLISSYCTMCDCLSSYLGGAYEIVVHSLGSGEQFIQKIVNGSHSGRSETDSPDSGFRTLLEQLRARIRHRDLPVVYYYNKDRNGGMVKSASIGIVGTGNKLIGIICLNCYLSTPFAEVLESFTVPANIVDVKSRYLAVNNNGYDTILSETISSAKDDVMSDPDIPYKLKKKEIIRRLHDSGVFQIKGGVAMCAEILGVTITTIYMHIRNLNAANGSTQHTDKQEEPIKQDK